MANVTLAEIHNAIISFQSVHEELTKENGDELVIIGTEHFQNDESPLSRDNDAIVLAYAELVKAMIKLDTVFHEAYGCQ